MIKEFLLNLLFPVRCLGCHDDGAWLCENCFRQLKPCRQEDKNNLAIPDLTDIFIAGDYNDPLLAELIKKFKYNFLSALGQPLGHFLANYWSQQIAANLIPCTDSKQPILVPIPLSARRHRWRGFNQAEILTQALADNFTYSLNLKLKRTKQRLLQANLSENERRENIKGAFVWTGNNLTGQSIILVDDVVTTGATLNEAARILKTAGAQDVYGVVLAKG